MKTSPTETEPINYDDLLKKSSDYQDDWQKPVKKKKYFSDDRWLLPIERSPKGNLEEAFNKLKEEWRKDTAVLSSIEDISMHHAYQRIIGMGKDAIPFMIKELEKQPGHWFWALSAITGENPIKEEDAGIMSKMAGSWIEWGRKRGYI